LLQLFPAGVEIYAFVVEMRIVGVEWEIVDINLMKSSLGSLVGYYQQMIGRGYAVQRLYVRAVGVFVGLETV